jgi:hypothetical protein
LTTARVKSTKHEKLWLTFGDPMWSTVTQLDFTGGDRQAMSSILLARTMRSLRRVSGIFGEVLLALCAADHALPIREIKANIAGLLRDGKELRMRDEPRGLPELRRLELDVGQATTAALRWLISSPLAGQLNYLELPSDRRIYDWAEMMPTGHPMLGELAIRYGTTKAHFRRGSDDKLSALELDVRGADASIRPREEADLPYVRSELLTSVTITR